MRRKEVGGREWEEVKGKRKSERLMWGRERKGNKRQKQGKDERKGERKEE